MLREKDPEYPPPDASSTGITQSIPRLKDNLEALLFLSSSDKSRY